MVRLLLYNEFFFLLLKIKSAHLLNVQYTFRMEQNEDLYDFCVTVKWQKYLNVSQCNHQFV